MSGNKARIGVRLDGDDSGLTGVFNRASAKASAFAAKMRGIGKGLGSAFTIGAVAAIGKSIISSGDKIQDTAEALGLSTDELQAFQAMAVKGKGGIDGLDLALKKLVESQARAADGADTESEAFAKLGIEGEDLTGSTGQLLKKIADGYAKTGNLAAVMSLLGKQTVGTSAFLKELAGDGLQSAIDKQKELGQVITTEGIEKMAAMDDKLSSIGQKFKATFVNESLPVLEYASGVLGGLLEGKSLSEASRLSNEVMKEDAKAAREKQAAAAALKAEGLKSVRDEAAKTAEAEKRMELEKIISGAKGESGLGSELVRIGARGGIAGGESPAVKLAKEQLATLKEVAKNTEPIADISTGEFTAP